MAGLAVVAVALGGCGEGPSTPEDRPPLAVDAAAEPASATIAVAASTAPGEVDARRAAAAAAHGARPGVDVVLVDSDDLVAARDRFAAQLLTAMSPEVHVFEVDVAAAAALAPHAVAVGPHVPADLLADVDADVVEALTVDGALVGVPLDGGRALVVSRYSPAPAAAVRVAVDLAVALAGEAPGAAAGLSAAPPDEDGPP